MKLGVAVAAAIAYVADASTISTKSVGETFGPHGCVMLTRSAAGSCVMNADCEGADLSHTEFAFDCAGAGQIVRHSFGMGGFESDEEFDSQVKCDRCMPATAAKVHKAAHKAHVKFVAKPKVPAAAVVLNAQHRQSAELSSEAKTKKFWPFDAGNTLSPFPTKQGPETAKYGPNGCVSTWRSEEGHCIVKTDCAKAKNISKYEFGLVCVDKVGAPVRHLFGKNSFDSEETFDTLIKCEKCLGLEDIPDDVALNGEVVTMSKDIANLRAVMVNISKNVEMLNAEVFPKAPAAAGPAPAPAAAGAPADAAPVSLFNGGAAAIDQVRHTIKHNLRHLKRRSTEESDDDSEYDDEGDTASTESKSAAQDDDEYD